ncbi:MAG: type IX secretion system membrane protein PorP/SprF [Bacteroidetes bacterium]|nr:type IX secretion system membrane protein PorP/SprF [Bacteroidota bacterium]
MFYSIESNAQQLLHRTQFMLHDFLLNPAAAGSRSRAIVQTGRRVQWQGIEGEPVNSFVSFHSPIEVKAKRKIHTQKHTTRFATPIFLSFLRKNKINCHLTKNNNINVTTNASSLFSFFCCD